MKSNLTYDDDWFLFDRSIGWIFQEMMKRQRRWQVTQVVSDWWWLQNSFRWVRCALLLQQQACDVLWQLRRCCNWWLRYWRLNVAAFRIFRLLLIAGRVVILKVSRRRRRVVCDVFVLTRSHVFSSEFYLRRWGWHRCLISVAVFLKRVFVTKAFRFVVETLEPELNLAELTMKWQPSKTDDGQGENSRKPWNSFLRRENILRGKTCNVDCWKIIILRDDEEKLSNTSRNLLKIRFLEIFRMKFSRENFFPGRRWKKDVFPLWKIGAHRGEFRHSSRWKRTWHCWQNRRKCWWGEENGKMKDEETRFSCDDFYSNVQFVR